MDSDFQIHPFNFSTFECVRALTVTQYVDIAHSAVLSVDILLYLVCISLGYIHLGIQGVFLQSVLWGLFLLLLLAFSGDETGHQKQQKEKHNSSQGTANRCSSLRQGSGYNGLLHLQVQGLHVGAILDLVSFIVIDEGVIKRQPATGVHQVPLVASQRGYERALDPGPRDAVGANDIDHLEIPLVPCFHLKEERGRGMRLVLSKNISEERT